jgi:hypothetical protein
MRDVSEAMRGATNDLRRQDPGQAGQSGQAGQGPQGAQGATAAGSRALEALRNLERQMQSGQPDERRRAMGEMQLEARQLADAQRQVASELGKVAPTDAARDAVRRLAGEEERLAERAKRLQDSLKGQATGADAAKEIDQQKLADRMRQSADAMRAASEPSGGTTRGNPAPRTPSPGVPGVAGDNDAKRQIGAQQELARALDRVADRIASAAGTGKGGESGKLSTQLARVQQLQERIEQLTKDMQQAGAQGRSGQGQGAGSGVGADIGRLRDEAQRAMQETRDLMDQLRREDPTFSRGGAGFTFEGQGMTTTAPGTEAFKQDFAKWEDLRRQATQALETAQSTISKKLQARESKERLAAGADDKAPPEYQKQVDDYFKAIAATKKKGG